MTDRARSEVDVANGALELCHQPPIASLSDPSRRARLCRRNLGTARNHVLSRRDWNFASEWFTPAASSTVPIGRFVKQFPLPPSVLVVREVEGLGDDEWEVGTAAVVDDTGATIEAKLLLCDSDAPRVRCTVVRENPAQWDIAVLTLIQRKLASMMPSLHREPSLAAKLEQDVEAELEVAEKIDAQEKAPTSFRNNTSWFRARRGGWRRW